MANRKLNKEDLVKLLTAMRDTSQSVGEEFHKDREWAMSRLYQGEVNAFDTAIMILTRPEIAEHLWKVFLPDEGVTA